MSRSVTPERLAMLVLIVATMAAAYERKQENETKVKAATPNPGNRLPPVVPALGIRG